MPFKTHSLKKEACCPTTDVNSILLNHKQISAAIRDLMAPMVKTFTSDPTAAGPPNMP